MAGKLALPAVGCLELVERSMRYFMRSSVAVVNVRNVARHDTSSRGFYQDGLQIVNTLYFTSNLIVNRGEGFALTKSQRSATSANMCDYMHGFPIIALSGFIVGLTFVGLIMVGIQ